MWYKNLNSFQSIYTFALEKFPYHVNFCWCDMIHKIERHFADSVRKKMNSVVGSVKNWVDAILTAIESRVTGRFEIAVKWNTESTVLGKISVV